MIGLGLAQTLWKWIDDRAGLRRLIVPFLTHLVPPGVGWWYVFGSATLVAFIIQVVTGIALATAYVPSSEDAYASLQFITHESPLGNLLRGMHFFGASAMVVLIGIHLLRVFLMAAFKFPRELNWLTGVALLGLTLAMAFTGQLLRWDQDAVWSVVVAASQAARLPLIGRSVAEFVIAGQTLGGATLSRFFAFHVFFIPALIFGLVAFHLYLILHNGISEPPENGRSVDPKTYRAAYRMLLEKSGQPFWPDIAWRDVAMGVTVIALVSLLALVVGPPILSRPPDPSILEAYPRPDWYLLWYFALLALVPGWLEDFFIVAAPIAIILGLIVLPFIANKGERKPVRRPLAFILAFLIVGIIGSLSIAGQRSRWTPLIDTPPLSDEIIASSDTRINLGARLFYEKGCEMCHAIAGNGGTRAPDLGTGTRLTADQITIAILNGIPPNMPAFTNHLTPEELDALVSFLQSRKNLNNNSIETQ